MSADFSRRSLLGAVIAAFLGFFSIKRASAAPLPNPIPAPRPLHPGTWCPGPLPRGRRPASRPAAHPGRPGPQQAAYVLPADPGTVAPSARRLRPAPFWRGEEPAEKSGTGTLHCLFCWILLWLTATERHETWKSHPTRKERSSVCSLPKCVLSLGLFLLTTAAVLAAPAPRRRRRWSSSRRRSGRSWSTTATPATRPTPTPRAACASMTATACSTAATAGRRSFPGKPEKSLLLQARHATPDDKHEDAAEEDSSRPPSRSPT